MERKPIRKTDSISTKLLFMILVPMLAMGIIITICASRAFTKSMCKEVSVELRNTAETVVDAYDLLYPGDYEMVGTEEVAIVKGEKVISTRSELIDRIKEKSGLEVSLFYYNTRIATTISDKEGNRLNGTVVNAKVEKEVLHKPIEKFYDNAVIDGRKYYAYYIPLFNSDNTCVGMVAVAKAAKEVNGKINQALLPIIIIAVLLMAVAAMITSLYAKQMINIFMSIRAYLNKVSDGRLDEEIDSNIMKRDDEIGEIGRSIMTMRNSLKEMVEIDTLTRVNNRRCGERKMKETVEQAVVSGVPYSIAIGDIDFFKKVNDRYGHECGDEVLKSVAHILKKSMLGKGYVMRWGGEEFLLIFDKVDYDEAVISLNSILREIESYTTEYGEDKVSVTMTFGIVEGDINVELHHQIKEADDKLYEGKKQGRNRIVS